MTATNINARWTDTYEQLSAADRASSIEPADLDRLAVAAYLIGRDRESADVLARAHSAHLARGDGAGAVRAAFWLAFVLMNTGERAQAAGWLARARRVLDESGRDGAERGYLLLPGALQHVSEGNLAAAEAIFAEAAAIGRRFQEADLLNLAMQGRGRTLIALGRVDEGVPLLDEVMVAVTSGEVSPIIAGTVYCSVVSACFEMFDMRRAQEWTDALNAWCVSQPDVVPYRGECLVHRAEIMTMHGQWDAALEEARRAVACLSQPAGHPALGAAFYQLGEIHRLRGEHAQAEEAYRRTVETGRAAHPGLALLWLAQERADAARAAICRVVGEARDQRARSRVLPAAIEILLACGDTAAARVATDQLAAITDALGTPFLRAVFAQANGAVVLAEGDPSDALRSLRDSCAIWRDLEAPYEAARTTVWIALACGALGDADTARMELASAAGAFRRLGAAPDLARVERLSEPAPPKIPGQLTARELEVLRLVADGSSNRAIAGALRISEKTVARHISNIFTKLDLPSRAAATAYAFRHKLI